MSNDSALKHDVENELRWEPSVREPDIGVSVKDGVVTLSGHVPSYAEKYGAERATKRLTGVRGIANELEVKLASDSTRSDEDLAIACVHALRMNTVVPDRMLKVVVNHGWVHLEGMLEWQYQKVAAEKSVRDLEGIRGFSDHITLQPRAHPQAAEVKQQIEAAIKRRAEIDAKRITVETRDGTVMLTGKVRSWIERDEAQHAAWSAPGVTAVQNDILITPDR